MFLFIFFFIAELHVLITRVGNNEDSMFFIEGIKQIYTIQVPLKKPLTRRQFIEAQKFWNCHFFEDKK